MNSIELKIIIEEELNSYEAEQPPEGSTLGNPWSNDKVMSYLPKLKSALVEPYEQEMLLRETKQQIKEKKEEYVTFWVIAEDRGYYQWYDPETKEYGLASKCSESNKIECIGIRGDLVGVYCAM